MIKEVLEYKFNNGVEFDEFIIKVLERLKALRYAKKVIVEIRCENL